MKKMYRILSVGVIALTVLCACVRETGPVSGTESHAVTFYAEAVSTRTAFTTPEGSVYPTLWTSNDQSVKIMLNMTESKDAAVYAAADGKSATFSASFGEAGSYTFFSVSPASAWVNATQKEGETTVNRVEVNIPTTQTPTALSVDEKAQLLVAKSETTATLPGKVDLHYWHLTAYGKMTLTDMALGGATVSSVSLTAAEAWAGGWSYAFYNGEVAPASSASNTITVNTDASGDIWFACAPVNLSGKSLAIEVKTDKGTLSKTITLPDRFESGKIACFSVSMKDIPLQEKVAVTGVNLNGKRLLTAVGKTVDLGGWYNVAPDNATDKGILFTSDHPEIATVSEEGVVTGVSAGDAVITLKPRDGSAVEAALTVRVADLPAFPAREKSAEVLFHGCDELTYFTKGADANREISIETSGQKEGTGWYKTTTKKNAEMIVINRNTSVINARLTSPHRGHVGFWFYIEPREDGNNAEKLTRKNRINGGRIEFSHAGGGGANKAIFWETKNVLKNLQDGWNWIDLAFKDAQVLGDGYMVNPEGLNWFRIFMQGPAQLYDTYTYGIDDIVVWEDYGETTASKARLFDFSTHNGWGSTVALFYNMTDKAVAGLFAAGGPHVIQLPLGEGAVNSGTTLEKGHLHLKLYVSDVSLLKRQGQIEIASSGKADEQELSWTTASVVKYCQNGWNDITLDLKRAASTGGTCDLGAVNWFRFYDWTTGEAWIQVSDIYLYEE